MDPHLLIQVNMQHGDVERAAFCPADLFHTFKTASSGRCHRQETIYVSRCVEMLFCRTIAGEARLSPTTINIKCNITRG